MSGWIGQNRLRIAWLVALVGGFAVLLAQFMDYTGFQIGAGGIESANEVAPRPIEFREGVGPDQLWLGIPVGTAALLALRLALGGQWRLGRAVVMSGVAMLALTLLILLPNGTDGTSGAGDAPGEPGAVYSAVEEKLLSGFWYQLGGSLALIAGGAGMVRWGAPPKPARRPRTVAEA